jgi:hypothetical protein
MLKSAVIFMPGRADTKKEIMLMYGIWGHILEMKCEPERSSA